MPLRVLFVLVDGLADVPGPGGRTPLQQARTPTLDLLASSGLTGLLDPVEAGVACGSDTAHLSLLGYDPRVHYRGRGALEALGTGLSMQPGDLAFKSVFALTDDSGVVVRRQADPALCPALCRLVDGTRLSVGGGDYVAAVRHATYHRCAVRIRGPGLADAVTGTDPLHDGCPVLQSRPLAGGAALTAQVINAFSECFAAALRPHRLALLLRGPSGLPQLPPFRQMHGMAAFMIAPTSLVAGIGLALQMDLVAVPGATGDHRSDFGAKFAKAAELLPRYDLGFVHIKAADEASHSGDFGLKTGLLEQIDAALAAVLPLLGGCLVVLTGDHTTPSSVHFDHTHHPVPFLATQLPCRQRTSSRLDEAALGPLGRFCGRSVMPLIHRLRGSPPPDRPQ